MQRPAPASRRAKPSGERTFGDEILGRLNKFTNQLKSTNDWQTLGEKLTVRDVAGSLGPTPYTATDVLAARQALGASQAVFAEFLGVSLGAVRDWEQSLKPPNGAARRMMDEIRHNPMYFARRIGELVQQGSGD